MRRKILRKVLFREKAPEYHSGAINKEKHLQGRCCGRRTQYGLGRRNMLKHANEESGLRNFFPTRKRTLKEKKYLKRNRRNVPWILDSPHARKRADLKGRLSLHSHLLRGILELLFVVPICGQHAQVAAVAPLSVLLSSVEELSSLLWVLLHHTGEMWSD